MKTAKRLFPYVLLILIGVALKGESQPSQLGKAAPAPEISHAVAALNPASGSQVHGTITFEKTGAGMRIVADLSGLTPGEHGFHIHEYGDCSSPDATSAGGHFNPMNMPHAGPTDKARHEGDMGNLTADKDGKAHLEWTDPMLSFTGPMSILGRSVIIHGGADDMKSQPSGNSGPRVACGVIGVAK